MSGGTQDPESRKDRGVRTWRLEEEQSIDTAAARSQSRKTAGGQTHRQESGHKRPSVNLSFFLWMMGQH